MEPAGSSLAALPVCPVGAAPCSSPGASLPSSPVLCFLGAWEAAAAAAAPEGGATCGGGERGGSSRRHLEGATGTEPVTLGALPVPLWRRKVCCRPSSVSTSSARQAWRAAAWATGGFAEMSQGNLPLPRRVMETSRQPADWRVATTSESCQEAEIAPERRQGPGGPSSSARPLSSAETRRPKLAPPPFSRLGLP
eukprot:15449374-Alexandrium_andersonii.AAC.1